MINEERREKKAERGALGGHNLCCNGSTGSGNFGLSW